MNIADIPLFKFPAPHLRGSASFQTHHLRDWGTGILFSGAACYCAGLAYLIGLAALLASAVIADFLFKAIAEKKKNFQSDGEIIFQGMLVALFVNTGSWAIACVAGAIMGSINGICGGRKGRIFQPACATLGILLALRMIPYASTWALNGLPVYLSAAVMAIWILIRRPRSRVEAGRMAAILIPVFVLKALHILDWLPALLWCAAAGELIFDTGIFPLTVLGRRTYLVNACMIFAFSAAVAPPNEALAVAGLTAGFLAAWLEQRDILGRVNGKAYTR